MADSKTNIQLVLQFVIKYLTLFHIVTRSIFSQIKKVNFVNCWCFDMFYYPTFFIHQNFSTDLTCMWVYFKLKHFVLNYWKKWRRGRNTFLGFSDLNKTLIFMSKCCMEAFLEINYELVFQRKEEQIILYHVPKRPIVLKKIDFWYFKVQVSKWTWIENFQILGFFFRQTGL